MCGKSPSEVQFSKKQKKRLKKGQVAMCKTCDSAAGSSGSAARSVEVVVGRPSPDGAKAIAGTESSKIPMVSDQVMHWSEFVGMRCVGAQSRWVQKVSIDIFMFA